MVSPHDGNTSERIEYAIIYVITTFLLAFVKVDELRTDGITASPTSRPRPLDYPLSPPITPPRTDNDTADRRSFRVNEIISFVISFYRSVVLSFFPFFLFLFVRAQIATGGWQQQKKRRVETQERALDFFVLASR